MTLTSRREENGLLKITEVFRRYMMNIYPIHKRKGRSEQSGSDILKKHQQKLEISYSEMFKDIKRIKEIHNQFDKVTRGTVTK